MKKIDIYEMIRKLNQFCESSVKMGHTSYTGAELNEALRKLGFSTIIASAIAQKCFPFEQIGKGRLYEVPKTPIHKSILQSLYDRQNSYSKKSYNKNKETTVTKSVDKTEEAWKTLVEAGVIKAKFNLNKLKEKYPKIYLDCIDYELAK